MCLLDGVLKLSLRVFPVIRDLCFENGFRDLLKGTVQQKLRGVLSGINRKLMIWAWAAWG
jgi:hypothetical protein